MKVKVESDYPCRSSSRIAVALIRHAPPEVEIVRDGADLVLIHVGGRFDHVRRQIEGLKDTRYAILQLVLRASRHPSTVDWLPLWEGAVLVWSFYDLADEMGIDGVPHPKVKLYHSPLGVDPEVFKPNHTPKHYWVVAEGDDPKRETLYALSMACWKRSAKMLHLGPKMDLGAHVDHVSGVTDAELVQLYGSCSYAAGLRTIEGFEFTAAEGLFCGARPLLFDRMHHRQWFGDLAEYVSERADVANYVAQLPERRVIGAELAVARQIFNWPRIAEGFWKRILGEE